MMKKKHILLALATASAMGVGAQSKDVTKQYVENPDFGARFAAWTNPGNFTYSVGKNFSQKNVCKRI